MSKVRRTISLVEGGLSRPIAITRLTSGTGVDPMSFAETFQGQAKVTPGRFLGKREVETTGRLVLRGGKVATGRITRRVNVRSRFCFDHLFGVGTNLPPSMFVGETGREVTMIDRLFLRSRLLSLNMRPITTPSCPAICPTDGKIPDCLRGRLRNAVLLGTRGPFRPRTVLVARPSQVVGAPLRGCRLRGILLSRRRGIRRVRLRPS